MGGGEGDMSRVVTLACDTSPQSGADRPARESVCERKPWGSIHTTYVRVCTYMLNQRAHDTSISGRPTSFRRCLPGAGLSLAAGLMDGRRPRPTLVGSANIQRRIRSRIQTKRAGEQAAYTHRSLT